MEVSGQLHASAALPPEKEPLVPIGQEASIWINNFFIKVIVSTEHF
jgi:hypothetical protein